MSHIKILCLLATFMIFYLVYHRCNISDSNIEGLVTEGLDTEPIIDKHCNDDPTWFVEDSSGKKNTCSDIGKTVSCYDMDGAQREGWERCLKSCGNCAKTTVTQLPMNTLAGFSGDPIEDFGVVLNMDADRQWVGKQDGDDDVRGYVDEDKDEDISDLYESISSLQDIVDLITGNVKSCNVKEGTCTDDGKTFPGCNGQCINCPTNGTPTPTESHSYIKQTCEGIDFDENCAIQFPAMDISCSNVAKILENEPDRKQMYPYKYEGCYNTVSKTGIVRPIGIHGENVFDNLLDTKCVQQEHCIPLSNGPDPGSEQAQDQGDPLEKLKSCHKICSKSDDLPWALTEYIKTGIPKDSCCTDLTDEQLDQQFTDKWAVEQVGPGLGKCVNKQSSTDWYPPFLMTSTDDGAGTTATYKLEKLTYLNHPDCDEEAGSDKCYIDDTYDTNEPDDPYNWKQYFTKYGRKHIQDNFDQPWIYTSNQSGEGFKDYMVGVLGYVRSETMLPTPLTDLHNKGSCYLYNVAKDTNSTHMALEYGNQCYCGNPDENWKTNVKERVNPNECGIDGSWILSNLQPEVTSIYSLINTSKTPIIDIYDYYYPKEGAFEPSHNSCKDYFLFDKIIDDDDDGDGDGDGDDVGEQATKDKNKISLYDMCPQQCGVTECN